MPIYEYQCQACGHQLEALQKMSDEPLRDCPNCGQSALSKQISAAGFRLKGGGWYETDFKRGSKRNVAEGGGQSASSGASSTEGAKPAATSSSTPKPAASGGSSKTATSSS